MSSATPLKANGDVKPTSTDIPLQTDGGLTTSTTDNQQQQQQELKDNKNKKLRRKQATEKPIMKYAWLAGHIMTLLFGSIYIYYYITLKSHNSIFAKIAYRFSLSGVIISYTVAILSQFNKKSLPSYFVLLTTENFQYLALALCWFINRNSAFKLFPYLCISTLQLSKTFKLKPILKVLEKPLELAIIYNELFLFILLIVDTLLMRGNSGYGLVIYCMFYWLRLLHSEDTRFFLLSIIMKLDGVISKQKNPKIVDSWSSIKKFLAVKQSKFEKSYLA
ncbi:hypothetical protein CANARDRAFT_222996 [[Candida] arabinofermentans NRRL YB-2248]|uniref:Uncharacterized protein n=1 Tax=[Candida] arabinofermentans NRRL YB-2248 TaxID=983967 RepID=A0A1E4SZA9_9ASCO|nr:hypothetical protein CANARDRAFT_222996 [[Candida] arabinofermentans NRRL YB-2248]